MERETKGSQTRIETIVDLPAIRFERLLSSPKPQDRNLAERMKLYINGIDPVISFYRRKYAKSSCQEIIDAFERTVLSAIYLSRSEGELILLESPLYEAFAALFKALHMYEPSIATDVSFNEIDKLQINIPTTYPAAG